MTGLEPATSGLTGRRSCVASKTVAKTYVDASNLLAPVLDQNAPAGSGDRDLISLAADLLAVAESLDDPRPLTSAARVLLAEAKRREAEVPRRGTRVAE